LRLIFPIFGFLLADLILLGNPTPHALFNGTTLDGWEGNPEFFRVVDQCIVAGSLERPIPGNQFLATVEEFENFDIRFEAKLVGPGKNAGVQFWSQRVPGSKEMIGYQCDIGSFKDGLLWGWLYDESRRRRFLASTNQGQMQKMVNPKGKWNQLRVKTENHSISIWLNKQLTVRYFEQNKEIPNQGRIGLQVHGGPPLEAWYRNFKLLKL
jgi:hypothetical protein